MDNDPRQYWRQKLGIEIGMSKDQALDSFAVWKEKQRSCDRCEEEDRMYQERCPIAGVCTQAKEREETDGRNIKIGTVDLRKGVGEGIGSFTEQSPGVSPKRITLGKHGRPSVLSRTNIHEMDSSESKAGGGVTDHQ